MDFQVAELLCTRLCHDLTGPIGAVNNGVEFLSEEEPGMQGQAVELIMSSATEAVSRLQFYRYAYGKINDSAETVLTDKKKLIADFFSTSKVTLEWHEQDAKGAHVTLSGAMTRLLFNMLIIASSTLLKGGSLVITVHCAEHERRMDIEARGVNVKWEKDAQAALDAKTSLEELTPKTVQFHLTRQLADSVNATLNTETGPEHFAIRVKEPVTECSSVF